MDLVDIYDESMKKIGSANKDDVHVNGFWHKSIHCWITRKENNKKYVLFQKRGSRKKLLPNYLDVTVAGHYQAGENIKDGIREVIEEFGVDLPFNKWIYLGMKFDVNRNEKTVNKEFCETFMIEENRSIDSYHISEKEVEGLFQIEISDGLMLFTDAIDSINATGLLWNQESKTWNKVKTKISRDSFIPRIDSYYAKIFVLADMYYTGYRYLFI